MSESYLFDIFVSESHLSFLWVKVICDFLWVKVTCLTFCTFLWVKVTCLLFILFKRIKIYKWKSLVCNICFFLCVKFLHEKIERFEISLITPFILLLWKSFLFNIFHSSFLLYGFSLTFPRFPRKLKNRLKTSLLFH